jgi:hypothetical protein
MESWVAKHGRIYNKNIIMKKVVRLTESDLTRLIKKVIKESEQDQQMVSALNKENLELASVGIPPVTMKTIEKFNSGKDISKEQYRISVVDSNEDYSQLPSITSQLQSAICNASKEELKQAKSQILDLFRNRKKKNVSEQLAVITILGITAAPWVFLAIGGFLLILIISRLVRWLSNRDTGGYGCRGRESWGGLMRRINSGY